MTVINSFFEKIVKILTDVYEYIKGIVIHLYKYNREELFIFLAFVAGVIVFVIIVSSVTKHKRKKKTQNKGSNLKANNKPSVTQEQKNIEKGSEFEDEVAEQAKWFGIDGTKVLSNLYVPYGNDEYTQIDVLVITRIGLFVIEAKNYDAELTGNIDDEYLKANYSVVRANDIYNPVKQNAMHCSVLKKFLIGKNYGNLPIHNFVFFSDDTICGTVNGEVSEDDFFGHNHDGIRKINDMINAHCGRDALDRREICKLTTLLRDECVNVSKDVERKQLQIAKAAASSASVA